MRIDRIDEAAEQDLRRLHELYDAAGRADDPHGPRTTYQCFKGEVTYGAIGDPGEIWAAREGAEIVGAYWIELPTRDNTHAALAELYVHPAVRRQGIGRELLSHLRERAQAGGRRTLISENAQGTPGSAFALANGAVAATTDVRQVLDLSTADPALYELIGKEAGTASAGYSLVRWQGPVPAEYRADMVTLRATMNDAPIDDLEWNDLTWNLDRLTATEKGHELCGLRTYTVAARHDASGELAAYTEIHVDGAVPWGFQEDTAVIARHRGHRLGLLIKLEMIGWLREQEPGLAKVITWNAVSNTFMRAVNERLGFAEFDRWDGWQLPV